jgi:hypothetical protein
MVLEYQNARRTPFPRWGWERPTSLHVLRNRRQRLAGAYSSRFEPVSFLLFGRNLPRGRSWPGTSRLISAPSFTWVDGVWTQVACTVPIQHARAAA